MNTVPGLETYSGFAILYAKHVYTGMRKKESVPPVVLSHVEEILAKINAGEVSVDWLPSV